MELDLVGRDAAALEMPRITLRQVRLLSFGLHQHGDASRTGVETYIRSRFEAVHGARVTHFLPDLVTVGHGTIHCACAGLAKAERGRLFAEAYLDVPAEHAIARALDEPVARSEILEIGNLVSTWKGGSLLLFVFLGELIASLGRRLVLFTATPEVERLLARLRCVPTALASANPEHLPDRGAQWGQYYERGPRVMFGEVLPAVAAARRDRLYRGVARAIGAQVEQVAGTLRDR